MKASLRRARAGDAPAMLELERNFPSDRFSPRAVRYLLRTRSAAVWVAESGRRVVGALVLLTRRRSRVARIYSVVVSPRARGRGVGAALIRAAERHARRHGRTAVSLEVRAGNRPARKLYAGLGYTERERLPRYYEDGAAGWRLVKRLD